MTTKTKIIMMSRLIVKLILQRYEFFFYERENDCSIFTGPLLGSWKDSISAFSSIFKQRWSLEFLVQLNEPLIKSPRC